MAITADIKIEIYKEDGIEPPLQTFLSLHPCEDSKEMIVIESGSHSYAVAADELLAAIKALNGIVEAQ